jgi:hypothetical protein
MTQRVDAIKQALLTDEAVRAELAAHTVEELAARYGLERVSIIKAEHRYGVRCVRVCATCKVRTPADQMRQTKDGKIGQICTSCGIGRPNQCHSASSHKARLEGEYNMCDTEQTAARCHWGRRVEGIWSRFMQGAHYADR